MAIKRQRSYLREALGRLTLRFRGKPRIEAVIGSWMAEFQAIEDAAFDVWTKRLLDGSPTTDLLDKLGKIVGQPRNGVGNDVYPIYIRARIKTNRSDGKHNTLLDIASLLLPTSEEIKFRTYLKALEIEATDVIVDPYVVWRDFLNRAKVAGDNLRFIFSTSSDEDTLTFASVDSGVDTEETQEFGSVSIVDIDGGDAAGVFGQG